MNDWEEKYLNWQKNGMAQYMSEKLGEKGISAEEERKVLSDKLAKTAYNLGFDDCFVPEEIEHPSWTDAYDLMPLFTKSAESPDLIEHFSADFKREILDKCKTEQEKALAKKIFPDMCRFFAPELINPENYAAGSVLLLKTYQNFSTKITDLSSQESFKQTALGDKIFCLSKYAPARQQSFLRLQAVNDAICQLGNTGKIRSFIQNLDNFADRENGLTPDMVAGLSENLLPDMKSGKNNIDEQYDNLSGMYFFDYGIGEFYYKCAATPLSPANIAELIRIYKELPATDWDTFNQNRNDGLALANSKVLGQLRDTIHDQRPATAELIAAMTEYYDNRDSDSAKCRLINANKNNIGYQLDEKALLDAGTYDEEVCRKNNPKEKEKIIDILRRLTENMNSDAKLPQVENAQMQKLVENIDAKGFTDTGRLGILLNAINTRLESDMNHGKIGISPDMLKLIVWADRKTAAAINDLDYERQSGAYKSSWFKQAAKFSLLINDSGKDFDFAAFDREYDEKAATLDMEEMYLYLSGLQNSCLINAQETALAKHGAYLKRIYPDLSDREIKNAFSLRTKETADEESPARRLSVKERQQKLLVQKYHDQLESMGSGNTLKALQNMVLYHEASTPIGRKRRLERSKEHPQNMAVFEAFQKAGIDFSRKPAGRDL